MRYLLLLVLGGTGWFTLQAQNFDPIRIGSDSTLDVLTWNLENFPKNGNITVNYLVQIIEAMDVDLLALQEVSEISDFETLLTNLPDYDGFYDPGWYGGLAYIYKPNTVTLNDSYEIFTASTYWNPFPRAPLVVDVTFMNQRTILVNNHLKCCGDGILEPNNPDDEEYRRSLACTLLKSYIDGQFSGINTLVLGDLNDILTDNPPDNVFQAFLDDDQHYRFADMGIAQGPASGWSYPSWPSHLDHILITSELFDDFDNGVSKIQTLKVDECFPGGWQYYDNNITDHRPVALSLYFNPLAVDEVSGSATAGFSCWPNPAKSLVNVKLNTRNSLQDCTLRVSDPEGQCRKEWNVSGSQPVESFSVEDLPAGVYFLSLFNRDGLVLNTQKLVILAN